MAAYRRRYNIEGAPFKINQKVKVIGSTDETFDKNFLNKEGKIEYYEYDCGCGQTYPHDPMIGVRFPDGSKEEFWKEELTVKSK